ncbi:MAG: pantetheine-phosphate adenylyltransferase [Clostridia bacterium]|nr:pantetheine-phosphate adenylyltransferase [Clostridia bacterium]
MQTAVYPGSFDPVTNGHLDIIERASRLYDRLVIGVLDNSSKSPVFSAAVRAEMLRDVTSHLENVEVDTFSGLLVDFASAKKAEVIVKGLRTVADFEYEFQMALLNKALNSHYETVFMMTDTKYSYISSSMVKEVAKYHGDLTGFVPQILIDRIREKF